MSRRLVRIKGDLTSLARALEIGSGRPELTTSEATAVALLRDLILPRLDPLPLVVSLVGSTGSGKSTLLNSIAGEVISPAGPLRPTTRQPVVWAHPDFVDKLASLGTFRPASHVLTKELALVDTPDLDSDLIDHRQQALETAAGSDAVIFVTTAARYGDDLVWRTLTDLSRHRRTGVVLNRLPSRASGARNDLLARLRRSGLGEVPVFSISEQRIDPTKRRLAPQSIQKLMGFLRSLGPSDRQNLLEAAADEVSELIEPSVLAVAELNRERVGHREAKAADYRARREALAQSKGPRWRRKRLIAELEALDRIAETAYAALVEPDLKLEQQLETGLRVLAEARFDDLPT